MLPIKWNRNVLFVFLFLFLLLAVSFLYNYHEILFYGPYSNHTWRQADCLSITQNYFRENLPFLSPEVHWIGNKGHGKTISEFPIIYYTVAQLWKIFGKEEFIFRLINIFLVFVGLFALNKLSYAILKDRFWSFYIPVFLFTSPLLIFYSNNFLPNAPAFGLALTGAYFYYLFDTTKQNKWMILSMLVFTLSGLLKITSLIIFVAILSLILLSGTIRILKKQQTLTSLIIKVFPFFCTVTILVIWYTYAHNYNQQYHRNIFLQGIFPIWELTPEKRQETAELLFRNLIPSYFNKEVLLSLLILFVSMLFLHKKTNQKLHAILIITFIGIMMYGILWFRALHVHDYYLTNILIFIPLILLVFLDYMKNYFNRAFKHLLLKSTFTLILLGLIAQGAAVNRLKYDVDESFEPNRYLIKQSQVDYWRYFHWDYKNEKKAFETITPYLRSIGISRNDKIISMSDGSINISLYFMDQKGLSKYGFSWLDDNDRIKFAMEQGCKYMVISDKDLNKQSIDSRYLSQEVGCYKNIHIYNLSN